MYSALSMMLFYNICSKKEKLKKKLSWYESGYAIHPGDFVLENKMGLDYNSKTKQKLVNI